MHRLAIVVLLAVLTVCSPLLAEDQIHLHFKLLPLGAAPVDDKVVAATEDVLQRRLSVLELETGITPSGTTLTVDLPGRMNVVAMTALLTRPGILTFRIRQGQAWQVVLTTPLVRTAQPGRDPSTGASLVQFEMGGASVGDVARITKQYVGQTLGIFVDDEEVSTPVLREPIESGTCVISGNLTRPQAVRLAALLKGGPLPVKVVAVP